jgi:hypothetical protein
MVDLIPSVDDSLKRLPTASRTRMAADFTDTGQVEGAAIAEFIRDTVAAALVAGANVTITPNDGSNTITIASSGGGGGSSWGGITGTLSAQTDLQSALDAKITAFADPNADRFVFWDDSAGAFAALSYSAPITITGTSLTIAAATESAAGIQEFATAAETVTGSSSALSVHPAGLTATRGLYVGVNAQTGTTYAPVLTDQGKLVTCSNAGAITVTMPSDATTAFPIGTQIDFVVIGAGMVTFVAGSSATVNGTPSLVTRAQWSAVTAIKRAANTWVLVGDLA